MVVGRARRLELLSPALGVVQRADGSIAFDWQVEWEIIHQRSLAMRQLHEAEYRATLLAAREEATARTVARA